MAEIVVHRRYIGSSIDLQTNRLTLVQHLTGSHQGHSDLTLERGRISAVPARQGARHGRDDRMAPVAARLDDLADRLGLRPRMAEGPMGQAQLHAVLPALGIKSRAAAPPRVPDELPKDQREL